ncbi:MAG: NAD(P)H-dependent oxidoreductase [Methylobacteriaceae bacterium]|nr:NAD(P)H-dependent oxidoreductase [Methylobacteriaceae bacterium]
MTTMLHVDASVRGTRSLSRRLGDAFREGWLAQVSAARVIHRDLAAAAPPFVDEAWIAACFTPADRRTDAMREVLAPSDELIAELEAAEVLVIATPMFNYGMPARLKAWIDQVVRVDRTFSFDLARGDWPLEPLLAGKILVLLTSAGEFGFGPGGVREHMNHLDPHVRVASGYLGVAETFHLGIEYQEFGDARHERSVADAMAGIPGLVAQVAATVRRGALGDGARRSA